MKKILALTSLIFALSVGATAMASDAQSVPNDPSGVDYTTENASGYATVLVQDSNNDIVYVDQNDSLFGTGLNLMLKPNLTPGTYTIKFGGAGKTTAIQEFTLTAAGGGSTDPEPADTVQMDLAANVTDNHDGTKNAAYATLVSSNYNKIKFTFTIDGVQKTATLDIDGINNLTGVAANVVVLVKNVPLGVTIDSVALVNVTESN